MADVINPTIYILIDGSYYCFYRYYALHQWWKNAKIDEKIGDNPYENTEFRNKYRKVFVDKIKEMTSKLNLKKLYGKDVEPRIIVGKDCHRKDIWRMDIYDKYKENRVYDNTFMGGPFFAMAYDDNLFTEGGATAILSHPKLEADDCLAITAKYIIDRDPNSRIYIMTSDTDYIQLLEYPQIELYNLAYKKVSDSKTYDGDPNKYLFMKILMGDKSDDIPGVFPKCGPKTAEKYWNDKELFNKSMDSTLINKYKLNTTLIDFNYIPDIYKEEFLKMFIEVV